MFLVHYHVAHDSNKTGLFQKGWKLVLCPFFRGFLWPWVHGQTDKHQPHPVNAALTALFIYFILRCLYPEPFNCQCLLCILVPLFSLDAVIVQTNSRAYFIDEISSKRRVIQGPETSRVWVLFSPLLVQSCTKVEINPQLGLIVWNWPFKTIAAYVDWYFLLLDFPEYHIKESWSISEERKHLGITDLWVGH